MKPFSLHLLSTFVIVFMLSLFFSAMWPNSPVAFVVNYLINLLVTLHQVRLGLRRDRELREKNYDR